MIDLQLAAYKAKHYHFVDQKPTRAMFKRKRIDVLRQDRNRYHEVMTRTRHDTWRRQEAHNKQLQHFLDRERFQQNATWQAEYDRLATEYGPAMQPYIDDRMDRLKEMIAGRQLDKLQWRPLT